MYSLTIAMSATGYETEFISNPALGLTDADINAALLDRLGFDAFAGTLTLGGPLELFSVAVGLPESLTLFQAFGSAAFAAEAGPKVPVGVPDGASTFLLTALGLGVLSLGSRRVRPNA